MEATALFRLLYLATLTSILFCVSSPCLVSYNSCKCSEVPERKIKLPCETVLSGNNTYKNSFNMCIIPNHAFNTVPCKRCIDTVYLRYTNISVIQPGAFMDLKKLVNLYIDHNEIQELHQNMFQHIPTLRKLGVSFNRLKSLHPEVFVNMTLYSLNVSHNALVLNGAILNSQYLNILDAAYCNPAQDASWDVLKHPAFSRLPNLTTLVLEGNAIRCLMSDTFIHNRRLLELNLKNNMLQVIPYQITLCFHIKQLHLSNNPLTCDCHMKRFSTLCFNNSVIFDEVSCWRPHGAWSLLEHLHCDNVPVTDSPVTGHCGSDVNSTNTVISAWHNSAGTSEKSSAGTSEKSSAGTSEKSSAGTSEKRSAVTSEKSSAVTSEKSSAVTSENNTTSAVLSSTSEVMISSLYADQQSVTSAVSSSAKISGLVELLINSASEMPSTHGQNPNATSTQTPLKKSSMWYILAIACVLVVIIVLVAVTLWVRRRRDFEGSVPATHYFNFHSCNSKRGTCDKVDDNHHHTPYISIAGLYKVTGHKPDLHYSCRDVTNLPFVAPEVPAHGQLEIESSGCSGILETDIDTLCTKVDLDGHVYEVVQ